MANRFTDSNKWDDPFFMNLSPLYKIFWIYLCDRCDHAGVWKVNKKLADVQIGAEINLQEILKVFNGRISVIADGEKWVINGFIKFQYKGELNSENKAHKGVLKALQGHGIEAPMEGLLEPLLEGPSNRSRSRNGSRNGNGDKEYSENFQKFWQAYPRKEAKGAAEKALSKVKVSLDVLLNALEKHKKSWDNPKYIPHPATWLNERRWEDETVGVPKAKRGFVI